MKTGFAKKVISPSCAVELGGYAARNKLSTGIHDNLYVKACSILEGKERVLIVSCDLLTFMYDQYEMIRGYCLSKYRTDNLIISATHTHSGPEMRILYDSHNTNREYRDKLPEVIENCIDSAVQNEKPAVLKYAKGHIPEVAKNRRAGETIVDDELNVLYFEGEKQQIIGFILNYSCHCTVLDSNNYLISSDYPQYIYSELETKYPESVAIFTNGACGDLNIGYSADASALGIDMKGIRSFENAKKKASFITNMTVSLIDTAKPVEPKLKFYQWNMNFPVKRNLPSTEAVKENFRRHLEESEASCNNKQKQRLELLAVYDRCLLKNMIECGVAEGEVGVPVKCALAVIGKIAILAFPGEMFCEIGIKLKRLFAPETNLIINGYANGYFGYFPTEKAHKAGGYECETSVNSMEFESYIIGKFKDIVGNLKWKQQ